MSRSLIDEAVKCMCDIWRPEDIPRIFTTGCSRPISNSAAPDIQAHSTSIATQLPSLSRNSQLPSPITPSTQFSPASYSFRGTAENTSRQPQRLIPLKGFVREVLCRSRTSVSVLQTALCYLEAIRSKVPELVEKEKNGTGVQGEIDLSYRVVQGDLEAGEWCEFELDSIMDNYINTDAAVDSEAVPAAETMSPSAMELAEHYEVAWLESIPYISLTGPKSNIAQDLAWTGLPLKIPTGPLPPVFPLPSPILCPRRTFLASLILATKFVQEPDCCYSNKAWAELSGLSPREIGRCERALGEALDWRLWVGNTPQLTADR